MNQLLLSFLFVFSSVWKKNRKEERSQKKEIKIKDFFFNFHRDFFSFFLPFFICFFFPFSLGKMKVTCMGCVRTPLSGYSSLGMCLSRNFLPKLQQNLNFTTTEEYNLYISTPIYGYYLWLEAKLSDGQAKNPLLRSSSHQPSLRMPAECAGPSVLFPPTGI